MESFEEKLLMHVYIPKTAIDTNLEPNSPVFEDPHFTILDQNKV
jgi:hypothetical protein